MEYAEKENENQEEIETIQNHIEYNIKQGNKDYILRLEIYEKNINIIISLSDNIEYNYIKRMGLSNFINTLELSPKKYSNSDLIINLFDEIYNNNKIFINVNYNNEFCILLIKLKKMSVEKKYELEICKNVIKSEEKFNILYDKIKLIQNNNDINDMINKMNKEIIELNNKLEKKNEEIKNILNEKNITINKMNKKLIEHENKIKDIENKNKNISFNVNEMNKKLIENENLMKDLESKNINIFNENKYLNDMFIKHKDEVKIINNKISNFESNFNYINNNINKINGIINDINNIKKEINELYNKNSDRENNDNEKKKKDEKIIIKINEEINKMQNYINMKFKEQETINAKINELIMLDNKKYENKINYKFKKDPKNLKFKENIAMSNISLGWNDIFEIFISYKDNKEYLVSPNSNNFKLDIYSLINNQITNSISGHNNKIRTIRYFMNHKDKNEYLISADDDKIVIIWDITNNYNIKYKINTKYGEDIYSCLLLFINNSYDNYIITSTWNKSGNNDDSATKIYSFNNGNLIKYFSNTNSNSIFYLLSWLNKRNWKYYIIQFANEKIIINNLFEDEIYCELIKVPEAGHVSGILYYFDNHDYLCSSSGNGFINIWDLYEKKIQKIIDTNGCELAHMIEWNKKYILVADYKNKSIKIIDLYTNSVFNISTEHNERLVNIKKINHPIYGESLLSGARDRIIKLWTID